MRELEVIARMKIRPGAVEGFTAQASEILRRTREKDTRTRRCDWFVSADGTACEVHETFADEQGLIEHKINTMEPTATLFEKYASEHHVSIYGDVTADFIALVTQRMGPPTVYALVQGLEPSVSI